MDDPAAGTQQGNRHSGHEHTAVQHGIQARAPLGKRRIEDIDGREDASAVDQHIQFAPALRERVAYPSHDLFVAVVAGTDQMIALGQTHGQFAQKGFSTRVQTHVVSLGRKAMCRRFADAGGGAGDQCLGACLHASNPLPMISRTARLEAVNPK